jgi:hypothetical protein
MLKIRNLSIKKINEYDRNKYNDYYRTENTKYTLDWRNLGIKTMSQIIGVSKPCHQ